MEPVKIKKSCLSLFYFYLLAIIFVGSWSNTSYGSSRQEFAIKILSEYFQDRELNNFVTHLPFTYLPVKISLIDQNTIDISIDDAAVYWSNSDPLRLEHIHINFEHILTAGPFDSVVAQRFRAYIASSKIIPSSNSEVIRLQLRNSNMRFNEHVLSDYLIGGLPIYHPDDWEGFGPPPQIGPPQVGPDTLTLGPYRLESISDEKIVWLRNDDWWAAKEGLEELPEPVRVVFERVSNEDLAIAKLAEGQVDAVVGLSWEGFLQVEAENREALVWSKTPPRAWSHPCTKQLEFNVQTGVIESANIRQAVSLALDRSEIAADVYDGFATIPRSVFPPYPEFSEINRALDDAGLSLAPDADVTAAHELLENDGWALGTSGFYERQTAEGDAERLKVWIHVDAGSDEDKEVVYKIVEQLKQAKIFAEAIETDTDEYWGRVAPRGEYDVLYGAYGCGSTVDPLATLELYRSEYALPAGQRTPGTRNIARWKSSDFDAAVDDLEKIPPGGERIVQATVAAYVPISESVPFAPIVHPPRLIAFQASHWTGWPTAEHPYSGPDVVSAQIFSVLGSLSATLRGQVCQIRDGDGRLFQIRVRSDLRKPELVADGDLDTFCVSIDPPP